MARKIKGITVVLISHIETGKDPFGNPIYEEKQIPVSNVLVAPTSSTDVLNSLEIYGKKAVYTLAIPKGDINVWEDQQVEFFGQKWRVFGKPLMGIDDLIPLNWNKKVTVEAYE